VCQAGYGPGFLLASCSNHCLAALDLGAGVKQPFDCPIVQNRQACSPWGAGWIKHWRKTWSTVCYSAPHSQVAEEAIPNLYKRERKRPTPVRRRLSQCADNWDHSFETNHLRPLYLRPRTFETTFIWDHSFETTSFETTYIWDHDIWDHIHLRPHSFETTVIWDHSHSRPQWLRPHLFSTTFILDHIHFRSHSFYAMSKWSCFDLLWITFL